ncbi:hypothetical protein [Nostoc sp. UIC 10630]|uniref:hypothetical protein n=1 Tax=Nostoc sp. UIC 10630 TaxID=2100146 RepID=UPI0013D6C079|nr:hypothetical protein [Nostoc sp. UIC 10630]NEU84487.1 hypothetical protein [Nostoc sp. UIC 10630]
MKPTSSATHAWQECQTTIQFSPPSASQNLFHQLPQLMQQLNHHTGLTRIENLWLKKSSYC